MGYYINPKDKSKEQWLKENGTLSNKLTCAEVIAKSNPGGSKILPVVLVDNGPFTAAAIAFSEREFEEFATPTDRRSKLYFLVEVEKLMEVCGEFGRWWKEQEEEYVITMNDKIGDLYHDDDGDGDNMKTNTLISTAGFFIVLWLVVALVIGVTVVIAIVDIGQAKTEGDGDLKYDLEVLDETERVENDSKSRDTNIVEEVDKITDLIY